MSFPPPLIPLGSAEPPRQKEEREKGESRVERGNREKALSFYSGKFCGKERGGGGTGCRYMNVPNDPRKTVCFLIWIVTFLPSLWRMTKKCEDFFADLQIPWYFQGSKEDGHFWLLLYLPTAPKKSETSYLHVLSLITTTTPAFFLGRQKCSSERQLCKSGPLLKQPSRTVSLHLRKKNFFFSLRSTWK